MTKERPPPVLQCVIPRGFIALFPGITKLKKSRRNLLIGAGAIAGVAALGGGLSLATNALEGKKEATVESISVPEDAVNALSDYSQADYTQHVKAAGSYKLAYGTLVWADPVTTAMQYRRQPKRERAR